MASSKYSSHKAMVEFLTYLFKNNHGSGYKQALEAIDLHNPYHLMHYLRKNDLISQQESKDGLIIEITEKGRNKVLHYNIDKLKIGKPKKWDGNWRIVFFDIPEKYKVARNYLTAKLKSLGFISIQKSVYVHPYPCLDEIESLRSAYGIRDYVFLVTTKDIENYPQKLRQIFKI